MSALRTALAALALAAVLTIAVTNGLLDPTIDAPVTTTTEDDHAQHEPDEDGESGPLPADPTPPPRALAPSRGLSRNEQQQLKARRIYIHAPMALGPVEIRAAGHRGQPVLRVTHTAVPVSAARTALRAARYAYSDDTRYRVRLRAAGEITQPGRGPIATAAASAIRHAVEINPAKGRNAISLPSILTARCQRDHTRYRCGVETVEFLADRTRRVLNAHRRSYQATVTTAGGKTHVTKITASP